MKMLKSLCVALAVALALPVAGLAMEVSGGDIVPGHWNSHFAAGKSYAEANGVPLVLFWASPGCSMCRKLEEAVSKDDFVAWAASKPYVFVFVLGTGTAEDSAAKDFAYNSSRDFPYISVYWKKPDGSVIKKNFTGRSGKMPSSEGQSLQEKFLNSIEVVLNGSSSGSGSGASETSIPEMWTKVRNFDGCMMQGDNIRGVVEAKFSKAVKRTGLASVKVKTTLLGGRTKTFSGKVDSRADSFELKSSYGKLVLSTSACGFSGVLSCSDGTFEVFNAQFGGNYEPCTLFFRLQNYPTEVNSLPVMTEWLPGAATGFSVPFGAANGKWTLPAKGLVKWDRKENRFIATKPENPAGLKLSYSPKTGKFKGSYYTYLRKSETSLKKVTTKIEGYVVNGVGYGVATGRGFDPVSILISH